MKMRMLAMVVVVGLIGLPIHAAKKLKEADAPTTKSKPNGRAAAARLRAEWDLGELRRFCPAWRCGRRAAASACLVQVPARIKSFGR